MFWKCIDFDSAVFLFLCGRYPPHGTRGNSIESGIKWDRLRAPPIDTCPYDLHVSDCLYDLQPADQVEIQWRRNKDFPYGKKVWLFF